MSFYPTSADGAPPEHFIFNELCALKDESGPCKAIKDRFFFNVDTGSCELFEYGGCGGNANNFETLEACEETCVVSGESDRDTQLFKCLYLKRWWYRGIQKNNFHSHSTADNDVL